MDPRYQRIKLNASADLEPNRVALSTEVIDEIYSDVRHAVNSEISEVREVFLDPVCTKLDPAQVQLTNLLIDKDHHDRSLAQAKEIKRMERARKLEEYRNATQNAQVREERQKRKIAEMVENTEDMDEIR